MGKYSNYSSNDIQKNREKEMHPIWRGVGFAISNSYSHHILFGCISTAKRQCAKWMGGNPC